MKQFSYEILQCSILFFSKRLYNCNTFAPSLFISDITHVIYFLLPSYVSGLRATFFFQLIAQENIAHYSRPASFAQEGIGWFLVFVH